MSNLLDRSSLVLTPTAYNNGEALCIKPDDGSGDFQFSRNSAATRVNAQGLVENVQILSSNLVQNGDFSEEGAEEVSNGSFSQEGAEQVTNGDFSSDTDWTKGTGWSISGGAANCDGTQTSSTVMVQSSVTNSNTNVKVSFTISGYVSGLIRVRNSGGFAGTYVSGNGTYVFYTNTGIATNIVLDADADFIGSIDNVSVLEVAQDWTLGTGWSIGEDKAICDGTSSILRQPNVIPLSTIVKVSFNINDYVSGNVTVKFAPNQYPVLLNGNGTYTIYTNGDNTANGDLQLISNSFIGSITNISVKEVGMDWSLGSGWSIGENKAIQDGTGSGISGWLRQQPLTIGKTYSFSCYVETSDVGVVGSVNDNWTSFISFNNGSGEYTTTFTPQSTEINFAPQSSKSYSVTNISVIEITDDTNLPRINYENFSYQDALGSEEIVNGSFDSDTAWVKGTGWSISGGTANCDGTQLSNSNLLQSNVVTSGSTYKITYTISNFVSGTLKSVLGVGGVVRNSNGVYSEYITATSPTFLLQANLDFIGSIDNVSVKEYLGQEVVPNSGCGSWLFEPQSTNLIPYSSDFTQWDVIGTMSRESGYLSPDGTNNAFKINGSTGSKIQITTNGFTVGEQYTFSIYLKADAPMDIGIGGITSDAKNLSITSEWQRYEVTQVANDTTRFPQIRYTGDLGNVYVWGAQVEQQSYPTSYIPTNGSTVSRNQDVCNNGGSLATINSTEGVLYAEIASLSNQVTSNYISLSDGTYSNRISLMYSAGTNIIRGFLRLGGGAQADLSVTVSDITEFHKVAFKFSQNDFALWIDGVEVATDTSGSTLPSGTLTKLAFSEINTTGGLFRGKTKCVAVWKEALSDSELQSLTTI